MGAGSSLGTPSAYPFGLGSSLDSSSFFPPPSLSSYQPNASHWSRPPSGSTTPLEPPASPWTNQSFDDSFAAALALSLNQGDGSGQADSLPNPRSSESSSNAQDNPGLEDLTFEGSLTSLAEDGGPGAGGIGDIDWSTLDLSNLPLHPSVLASLSGLGAAESPNDEPAETALSLGSQSPTPRVPEPILPRANASYRPFAPVGSGSSRPKYGSAPATSLLTRKLQQQSQPPSALSSPNPSTSGGGGDSSFSPSFNNSNNKGNSNNTSAGRQPSETPSMSPGDAVRLGTLPSAKSFSRPDPP